MNKHTRGQRIGCLICIVSAAFMVLLTVAFVRYAVTHLRPAEDAPEMTVPVVSAAATKTVDIQGFCAPAKAAPEMTVPVGTMPVLETYTDGDAPVPAWWNPDEPMAAEWYAPEEPEPGEFGFMAGAGESCRQVEETNSDDGSGDFEELPAEPEQVAEEPQMTITAEPHPPVGIDPGGIDWNLCTTLWGWDGHSMEVWEMDLYSRIVYLEFWGTSPECCEAGADSILQLWDAEYYGRTIGETLTARAEDGSLVYSPYAYVWDWDYDPEGLADMRALCEERFANGPEWSAPFFRLNYYHPWAIPCYQIDNVFFSTAEGWQ